MRVENIIQGALSKLVGKKVYFMKDNAIVAGKIGSYDQYNIFFHNKDNIAKAALSYKEEFFLSIDELLKYLKSDVQTLI